MKKILVTTDFSPNSTSGLLFAAQLATQMPAELTFCHILHILRPTSWDDATFQMHKDAEIEKAHTELVDFVSDFYKNAGIQLENSQYLVEDNASTGTAVSQYALKNTFDYICISTRGAGFVKKIVGNNTSMLIKNAEVPVITVPHHYQSQSPVSHILYASDLKHLEAELNKVVDFAKPLAAKVELLHFNTIAESLESEAVQATIAQFLDYKVEVHLENTDYVKSLVVNIQAAVEKSGASMLVMFTEQNRTFFQKIFVSSKAAEYSFDSKVPMLTFKR